MILILFDAGTDFVNIATRGGPVAALLGFILWGGFKKDPWWVFGWVYRDMLIRHENLRAEKDAWRDTALHSANIALTLSKKKVDGD